MNRPLAIASFPNPFETSVTKQLSGLNAGPGLRSCLALVPSYPG
jgi:hypothetical protein